MTLAMRARLTWEGAMQAMQACSAQLSVCRSCKRTPETAHVPGVHSRGQPGHLRAEP